MDGWKRTWVVAMLVVALTVVLGVMAMGCGGDTTTTTAAGSTDTTVDAGDLAEDQTLTINITSEPPSLDPNLASDTTSSLVINNIFEGLVHIDAVGGVFPGVAETWDVSEDGLVYTFNLRGTDTWTNGDTVTSTDFKNSWLRILDPETAADYAYMLYFIVGAEAYNSGEGAMEDVAIDATDPAKLVVTLVSEAPWFVSMMAHQAYFPIHKATVDAGGDAWTEPANIVTNGPYLLDTWNHDSDILLTKRPDWREADSVVLENVKMVMIAEETTGVAAFEAGEIDVQKTLPVADIDRLKALPQYRVVPLTGTYYFGFNTKKAPLDDPKVRMALSMGIDRQSIVDNITKGGQIPAVDFTPGSIPGYDTIKQGTLSATADVEGAKALLAEAGFPEGAGLPEIVIYHNTSESHAAVATAVQAQWKAIGVNATVKNMEWKQYLDFVQNNDDVMVYRMGWVIDYLDAYNMLELYRTDSGNNYTRWGSAEYDQLLADSLNAADEQARWDVYAKLEKILQDEMPIAPIYWYVNQELVADHVTGYEPSVIGETTNFWTVKILKK